MVTFKTQTSQVISKLEEAAEVIRVLTARIREEVGEAQPLPFFQSKEEVLSKLFPDGLPLDTLGDNLQKIKDSVKENRKHARVALIQEVEYEGEVGTFRSRLSDLSEEGIFIDTATPFPPEAIVKVKFRLPDSEEPISATAEVRHARKGLGMGVRFLDLKPEDRKKISKLVEIASSQKELIGRERARNSRVTVRIPVTLKGVEKDGTNFQEPATLITISKSGACILTNRDLAVGLILFLHTPEGLKFKASVGRK